MTQSFPNIVSESASLYGFVTHETLVYPHKRVDAKGYFCVAQER